MVNGQKIRLGLMAPLSGIVGIYGQEIVWAGKIACREVNENGGVCGRELELMIEDDGSLPESSVRAAERLLDGHGCVALIGNLMTNSRIAVAYQIAEPRKIPYLGFSLYEGSILSRYYFHFAAIPNQQIDLMIPFMKDLYGPKMFFCGNSYEWPRGSIGSAKRILERVNGECVGEEYYSLGLTSNDTQQLMKSIEKSGADVIVPFFAGTDEITVLKSLAAHNINKTKKIVMTHFDEVMASYLSPEERDGLYSSNSYFMSIDSKENHEYLRKLSEFPGVTGIYPQGNGVMTNFGEGVYVCVKAFAKAANAARVIESEAIVDELEKIFMTGPQGYVEMDPVSHHALVHSYLARCQASGDFAIVRNFGIVNPVIPERYRSQQISLRPNLEAIRLQARIIEQMNDAVCLIDASDETIVYANPGFERMFGHQKDEVIGQSSSILYTQETMTKKEIGAEISEVLFGKGVWRGERRTVKKDGTVFWCRVGVSAFTHARYGEVLLESFTDITELKQALDDLMAAKVLAEKAQASAEEANSAKEFFLAVLSHELRTPLSPVLMGISILQEEKNLDPSSTEILEMMGRNIEMEIRLIDDLLDWTKIKREKIELIRQRIDLCLLLEQVSVICREEILAHHLDFTLDYGPNRPFMVDGDPVRLQQVFSNLIRNSIKFTPEHGRIGIRCLKQVDRYVIVEFFDSGIGIDAKALPRVFDAFEQGERKTTRLFGGLGLGLAISKSLVELHGGTIEARSKGLGQGASFLVKLPLSVTSDSLAHTPTAPLDNAQKYELKILIVEDHLDTSKLLEHVLQKNGYKTTIARTIEEALSIAANQHFDLMISDIGLPDGSGCELLLELRRRGNHFPAVALSGYGQEEDIRRSLGVGFFAHITKPVMPSKLIETLGLVIRGRNS